MGQLVEVLGLVVGVWVCQHFQRMRIQRKASARKITWWVLPLAFMRW
jgi:hypothetical protein